MKLRAVSLSTNSVTFPGDYLSIPLTSQTAALNYISITPSFPKAYDDEQWKPQVCEIIDNTALFRNNSHVPMLAAKHSHFKPNHVSICALHEVGSCESSSPDSISNSKYRAKPSPYKSIPEAGLLFWSDLAQTSLNLDLLVYLGLKSCLNFAQV